MTARNLVHAAAALALAAAVPAQAAIEPYTTGNGELFFNLYDATGTPVSFFYDLRPRTGFNSFRLNDFLPGGRATATRTRLEWVIDDQTPGFADFKRIANVQEQSSWQWNVVAGDSTGNPNVASNHRYLTTSTANLATIRTQSNTNLIGFNTTAPYVTAINAASPAVADASGIVVDTAGATSGYFGEGFQDNWLVKAVFDSTAPVGQEMDFFLLFNRPAATAGVTQFENAVGGDAKWNFEAIGGGAYRLSYSVPMSAPGTLAALAGGLGLLALTRRNRRK